MESIRSSRGEPDEESGESSTEKRLLRLAGGVLPSTTGTTVAFEGIAEVKVVATDVEEMETMGMESPVEVLEVTELERGEVGAERRLVGGASSGVDVMASLEYENGLYWEALPLRSSLE